VLTSDLKMMQGDTTLIRKIESSNHPKDSSRMTSPAKENKDQNKSLETFVENVRTQKCSKNFLSLIPQTCIRKEAEYLPGKLNRGTSAVQASSGTRRGLAFDSYYST
jgi:hypothetical protein